MEQLIYIVYLKCGLTFQIDEKTFNEINSIPNWNEVYRGNNPSQTIPLNEIGYMRGYTEEELNKSNGVQKKSPLQI